MSLLVNYHSHSAFKITPKYVNQSSELRVRLARHETGLSPPVKCFTNRYKAVLLLWIFYTFSVLWLLCLCVRLFICALWSHAGTSWLSFVVSNCEFVTFPLVSWVRSGFRLYRFLIFAPLLTLQFFSSKTN